MEPHHFSKAAQDAALQTSEYLLTHDQIDNKARFLALAQESSDIYWLINPGTHFSAVTSSKWESFTGHKISSLSEQDWLSYIHKDDRDITLSTLRHAASTQQSAEIECRIHRYDDVYRIMWLHYVPVHNASGAMQELIAYAVDITTKKQWTQFNKEQDLNIAMKMNAILNSISDAFFSIDMEWHYTYVNSHAENLLGQTFTELAGQRMDQGGSAFTDIFFMSKFREVLTTKEAKHFEGFAPPLKKWFDVHAYPTPDGLSIYTQDITERKQTEKALRDSELKFRRFVESDIIGVLIVDIYGNIHEANNAYLSLTGYTMDEIKQLQLKWTTMTVPECLPRQAEAIEEFLSTGLSKPFETVIWHKDGKKIPIILGMAQLKSSSTQGVAIVMDISARKAVEQQKDVYLSMTGHELRTPLTIIKSSLQLLQRRLRNMAKLSPSEQLVGLDTLMVKSSRDLAHSLRQIDIQARMINDLLDISRIAIGKLEVHIQRCNLTSIAMEMIEDLRTTVPERAILSTVSETRDIYTLADPDRVRQVISNYVTNAIKYSSPEYSICIGLTSSDTSIRFWVEDKGPGLSKEDQKHVWDRFYQVKGSSLASDRHPGLGLGLYICQTIIQRMQGDVGVESEPGKGSTFWFTLPLAPDDEAQPG
jgi:PAS domain S-box-containing protein